MKKSYSKQSIKLLEKRTKKLRAWDLNVWKLLVGKGRKKNWIEDILHRKVIRGFTF